MAGRIDFETENARLAAENRRLYMESERRTAVLRRIHHICADAMLNAGQNHAMINLCKRILDALSGVITIDPGDRL